MKSWLTVDIAALNVHEPAQDAYGPVDEVGVGFRVLEQFIEPDADDGNLRGKISNSKGVVVFLEQPCREMLGVEAVLAGVLVAGLAARLTPGGSPCSAAFLSSSPLRS